MFIVKRIKKFKKGKQKKKLLVDKEEKEVNDSYQPVSIFPPYVDIKKSLGGILLVLRHS